MEFLVIGSEQNFLECQQKFGEHHKYKSASNYLEIAEKFHTKLIVFDFLISQNIQHISIYRNFSGILFLEASKISLTKLISENEIKAAVFGFCGIPTFLKHPILEVTLPDERNRIKLEEVCAKLNTSFAIVKDQVGMVTPRVICMVINEAYFAVEENIANRVDIDLAMKLGTNYPFGPFEWASRIGLKNVYDLLRTVYERTNDERYKISDLLKREANPLGYFHRD